MVFSSLLTLHVDENCTSSQRHRQAGHGSDSVYDKFYTPTNAGVDGQALYAGDTPRTRLFDLLRFLKMDHDRELAQTLPAKELHELINSEEYSAIRTKLDNVSNSKEPQKARAEIQGRLRSLKCTALENYRKQQKENPPETTTASKAKKDEGHYRTPFHRIRHLMPLREYLSKIMFTVATIRSEEGKAALEALVELYRSEYEVKA